MPVTRLLSPGAFVKLELTEFTQSLANKSALSPLLTREKSLKMLLSSANYHANVIRLIVIN